MNSLESGHSTPEFFLRRKSLARLKQNKPMFEQLMGLTNQCMRNNPQFDGQVHEAIQCEHIDPAVMSNLNDYTFHTHPMGDIDYPSDVDINTTMKLKKDWLLIGLATKNKVAVYHKGDGFKKKVAEF